MPWWFPVGAEEGMRSLILRLCRISECDGNSFEFKGLYHWIAFSLPDVDASRSVANRYFEPLPQADQARGIELRREISPFHPEGSMKMLYLMASAQNSKELEKRIPQILPS